MRLHSAGSKEDHFLFVYRAKYKLSTLGQRFQSLDKVVSRLAEYDDDRVVQSTVADDGGLIFMLAEGGTLRVYPSVKSEVLGIGASAAAPNFADLIWEIELSDGKSLFAIEAAPKG